MYKLNGGDTEWDGVKTKTGSTSKNMVIVLTIQNLIPPRPFDFFFITSWLH